MHCSPLQQCVSLHARAVGGKQWDLMHARGHVMTHPGIYKQAQLHRKRLSMSVATEVSDTADAESSNANPFRGKHGVAYGHFRPAELELLHKDHE